ncbi:unnamed protein product [Vitrella brassicaformis CCMP3155]|uniref:Uncharacterized protein n=1 Tax=Vitrella brassicaformis (strain CCMP3155) TaxID=1169540 RepID=A0A0G4GL21_VITBC|nr:unnamed protein product [Vitrella brassicaformis CCMP3155]|eukprot:CEM30737.1 unnamed protein product [Vitrella brassicaformis CCMP3155]
MMARPPRVLPETAAADGISISSLYPKTGSCSSITSLTPFHFSAIYHPASLPSQLPPVPSHKQKTAEIYPSLWRFSLAHWRYLS